MKKTILILLSLLILYTSYSFADNGTIPEDIFTGLSTVLDNQHVKSETQPSDLLSPNPNGNGSVHPGQSFSSKIEYRRDRNHSTMTINLMGLENVNIAKDVNQISMDIPDDVLIRNMIADVSGQDVEIMDRLITSYSFIDQEGTNQLIIRLRDQVGYNINQNPYGVIIELTRTPRAVPRIVIDPGHGAHDGGASSKTTGALEKTLTLRTSLMLRDALVQKGYEVIMTRDSDIYPTLTERAELSNSVDADLFISIHYNSATLKKGTTSHPAQGIETLFPFTSDNKAVAEPIQKQLIAYTGAKNRGLKNGSELVVLKKSKAPGALVELGFLSNADEAKRVLQEEYQQKLVMALSTGIDMYFGR